MKTYTTPALVAVGSIVNLTQGAIDGSGDGDGVQKLFPAGSVGFNL
jgi:hypothetical protein